MPRGKRKRFDEAASLNRLSAVGANAAEAAALCRELAAAQHVGEAPDGEGGADRIALADLYKQLARLYEVRARRTAATLKLLREMSDV
jgi:hypothetical protein